MYLSSEKLLAILLVLLIGLFPLQGAIAGLTGLTGQQGKMHQMTDIHSDGVVMNGNHDNTQTGIDADCSDHDCASCQCASCTLAILPVLLNLTNVSVIPGYVRTDPGIINHAPSSPFRPPRP
ncbi:MAG: hypothetical protein KZQ90_09530 [Candidatus Thiodiazotropha sp. (ex Codakia rugifera)]|nr:hypothetical protein [Candidatus Thiodiazotropha sp. (ex Codakia rugifera)]